MTEPLVMRTTTREPWPPGQWVAVGLALVVVGAVLGVITNDDTGVSWSLFALVAVPGVLMANVGLIAKAVQVGIRAARD